VCIADAWPRAHRPAASGGADLFDGRRCDRVASRERHRSSWEDWPIVTEPERPTGPAGQTPATPPSEPPTPASPDISEPRWQPFAATPPTPASITPAVPGDPGSALPDSAALPPEPTAVSAPHVPEQLPDATGYIPSPMAASTGSIPPPVDPTEVPSSAWITTAPTVQSAPAKGRSGGRSLLLTIVGVAAVLIVGALVVQLLPSDKGKVLFGTAPGSDLCSVGNQTTTVKTTEDLYFAAVLKDHMDGDQAITLKITKNGQDFINYNEPADGTAFDCYGNRTSLAELGPFEAGQYHFEVLNNGKVEAAGDLTITT